jgi:hypothetical protein
MKSLDLAQANDSLASYVQDLGHGKLVVVQDGQPIAVLMPVTEDELEDIGLSQNPEFLEILEQSRMSLREKGGISLEQMQQQLGLA